MLDIEQLLGPIPGDSPTGEDLSFSHEFDAIAEARRADDPTLEQGAWQTELKTADWPEVIKVGSRLLQEQSKDLRIAVWLTEAQTQLHGFAGLAWGYRLTTRLCESFWDDLFPQDEEDDDGMLRVGHVRWLLTHSERWVRTLPITQASEGQFSANDFQSAFQHTHRNDAAFTDRPTAEQVDSARQSTPFEFFNNLSSLLPDCLAALSELEAVMDEKVGDDGPGFRSCREAIENVSDMIARFVYGGSGAPAEPSHNNDESDPGQAAPSTASMSADVSRANPSNRNASAGGHGAPVGEISSRREALAQLRQVAAFFRRTEPQSPVAYLADKAAKWGEMPLHVWLRRVIKDEGSLSHVEELLDVGQDKINENR